MNFMDSSNKYSLSVESRIIELIFFFITKKFNFEEKKFLFQFELKFSFLEGRLDIKIQKLLYVIFVL